MTCSHDPEVLSALLDGGLSGDALCAAEAQVAQCTSCRDTLHQLQSLQSFMQQNDPDLTPTGDFDLGMSAVLRAERRGRWAWLRRPAFLAPALSASAAVLIAVTLFVREPRPSDDDLFIADNQEMLAELDLVRDLDAVEDYDVIHQLNQLKQD